MKKIQVFFLILITVCLYGCEDVVQVDLKKNTPRLVVEASINWYKGTSGNQQKIRLTTTTDFYSNTIPVVSGATIFIKDSSNAVFNFVETLKTGEYVCVYFSPKINETYTLTIISNGQTYTATETLKSIAPIANITQNNQGGFAGNNIEIKTHYKDPANEDNYYLYRYVYSNQINSSYYVDEDALFEGNEFFSISQNSDLKTGDKMEISHFGISKTYFNYMRVIVSIAGNSNGSPFQSPPATVRGNIINTSNFDNYALGYFSLSEVSTKDYTVE